MLYLAVRKNYLLTDIGGLDGHLEMVAFDQGLISQRMLEANLGFVLFVGGSNIMQVPETIVTIIGHFLLAAMFMDFFCHLVAAQQFPDRSYGEDLDGKNAEEDYGQKFSHDWHKDNVYQVKTRTRQGLRSYKNHIGNTDTTISIINKRFKSPKFRLPGSSADPAAIIQEK